VARYGGDEFVALLVDTDSAGAQLVAGRMRELVERLQIEHHDARAGDHVSISLGVATIVPQQGQPPEDLVRLADQALYAAKGSGRNRIVVLEGGTAAVARREA
jgi:diguanylate cyclase (GGDEF)-like protein